MKLRLLVLVLGLGGCAVRVHVESLPSGATLTVEDGVRVSTPTDIKLKWTPFFGRQHATVSAPGYRTIDMDIQKRSLDGRFLGGTIQRPFAFLKKKPSHEVEYVLIPEHGPSGTWTPESEGLAK